MKNLTPLVASRALIVAALVLALAGCGTTKPKPETATKSVVPEKQVVASTNSDSKPIAPPKKPIELMDSLARSINNRDFTEEVKRRREEIVTWQMETEAKKAPAPLILEPYADFITVAALEKALGKPDKKTVEKLPGFTRMSGVVTGNYYWYGNVGFGFLDGGNGIERIWVMEYVIK